MQNVSTTPKCYADLIFKPSIIFFTFEIDRGVHFYGFKSQPLNYSLSLFGSPASKES